MHLIEDLKAFYNSEASTFSQTRKKEWPEFSLIVEEIEAHYKKKVRILELGCGDGRLVGYLRTHCTKTFSYTGIDLSDKLIDIAHDTYPKEDFEVSEMENFMEETTQESYDIIVAVASFQHLINRKSRLLVLHHCYKALDYDGLLIMINWSFSKRFLDKFWKPIVQACWKYLYTFGFSAFNDIMVPWKAPKGIFLRYYHIFLLSELKELFKLSGFIQKKASYITPQGHHTDRRVHSRNTWIVGKKSVLKE